MPLGVYFVQPDIYGNCRECDGHTYTTSAWGCVVCFNYLGNAKAFTSWNGQRTGSTFFSVCNKHKNNLVGEP